MKFHCTVFISCSPNEHEISKERSSSTGYSVSSIRAHSRPYLHYNVSVNIIGRISDSSSVPASDHVRHRKRAMCTVQIDSCYEIVEIQKVGCIGSAVGLVKDLVNGAQGLDLA